MPTAQGRSQQHRSRTQSLFNNYGYDRRFGGRPWGHKSKNQPNPHACRGRSRKPVTNSKTRKCGSKLPTKPNRRNAKPCGLYKGSELKAQAVLGFRDVSTSGMWSGQWGLQASDVGAVSFWGMEACESLRVQRYPQSPTSTLNFLNPKP